MTRLMAAKPLPHQKAPSVDIGEWKTIVAEFQKPSTGRAVWQIINTLGPYTLLWYLMYRSLAVSWWITVPLAMLAGAFLVRVFIIRQRLPSARANPRECRSVHWMNVALLGMAGTLGWIYGFVPYLLIQLTAMAVAGAAGVWMFYVQHQFEDVYWERGDDWDYTAAALQGSSFYELPKILQWFSGNIGFHHIHHLSSRIPNYNLERCGRSHPMFRDVKPITLFSSLKSLTLRLWDEKLKKLVVYRHVKGFRRQQNRTTHRWPKGSRGIKNGDGV